MAKQLGTAAHKRLFFLGYEKNPQSVNITSLPNTPIIADKNYDYHPFHIPIRRRLAAFDPHKLHWTVSISKDVSRSAYIRDFAVRRVRHAFRDELRRLGWDSDGRWVGHDGAQDQTRKPNLSGALRMSLVRDPFAITATSEEVKSHVKWAVKTLVRGQESKGNDGAPPRRAPYQGNTREAGASARTRNPNPNHKPARRDHAKG